MNLQLAESDELQERMSLSANPAMKPYVFVPGQHRGKGTYVREDLLDAMPSAQYTMLMRKLAPHQREVQSGAMSEEEYLGTREDRRQRRAAKTDKKKSKAELKRSRGQAKIIRAQNKNKGRGQGGGGQKVLDTATDVAGKIFGGKKGAATDTEEKPPFYKTTAGMIAIGLGAVLLLGGGGYLLTRKKKK
jgi:LPXTG-motif cell wall-anchored protein